MDLAVGASEATIKSLLTKLGTLLADEYTLVRGVRGDIQFIRDELASMQAFLNNLSHSKDGHDDQTEDWMKQIREVAYDIEDCIDDSTHRLNPDRRGDDLLSKIVRKLHELRTWWPRRTIAAKIAELKERAQHVGERRTRYGVPDPDPEKKKSSLGGYFAAEHQETTRRLVSIDELVGVEKEMEDLERWIIDDNKQVGKELGVLSIFGFGGVGKTAAAKALYRRCGVHFKCQAIVTVSHGTDHDEVLKDILKQLRESNVPQDQQGQIHSTAITSAKKKQAPPDSENKSLFRIARLCARSQGEDRTGASIKEQLKSKIDNNRYLLLIDDVWSLSTWLHIKDCLPENNTCSRVIVTTRFEAVAKASLGYLKFHKMPLLSSTDAQDLFKKSLESSRQSGLMNLVPARVWEMCGGLPLPIVTMAGLVASKPYDKQNDWLQVCKALFPETQVCQKSEEFMRIISYCHTALPGDLKTCSLYLCLFPKGRKIRRKRLIRRWIAEGFVSEKDGMSMEDIAEVFFNQLIDRKIIRPVENSSDGKVKSYQVHDMVVEYIISKAGEENFATVVGSQWSTPAQSYKVRRLALHSTDTKRAKEADRMNLSHVRSLTVFGTLDQLKLKSFKAGIVQVLDLEGCEGFKENRFSVSDICKMTLLKYLSLRGTDVSKLPSNIGDLKYLETLDVRETEVPNLPASVGRLERIRNILGGNKGKRTGDKGTRTALTVPKEIKGVAKTLHVLSGIEFAEVSNIASELNHFTALRKLAIYRLPISEQNMAPKISFKRNTPPNEKSDMLKEFFSSIQYLGGYYLQSLVIDVESSDVLHQLHNMTSPPIYLTSLELSGRLDEIPKWLPRLSKLVKLSLSATALRADTLKLLSKLGTLFSLTFSVCGAKLDPDIAAILEKNKSNCKQGEIFVPSGGFGSLQMLRIFMPHLPSLNFSQGAMSALKRLELRFERLEGLHGMDKLGKLDDVIMTVGGKAGGPTKLIIEELKSAKGRYVLNVHE